MTLFFVTRKSPSYVGVRAKVVASLAHAYIYAGIAAALMAIAGPSVHAQTCGPLGCPPPSWGTGGSPVIRIPKGSLAPVVRVVMPVTGSQARNLGSGSVVAPGLVVTNFHVVEETHDGRGSVIFQSGERVAAKLIDYSTGDDLAVLQLAKSKGEPAPIGLADASVGDTLVIAGFGGGTLLPQGGTFAGVFGGNMVVSGAQSRQGDSGGPIINTRGQLVGVLWGARSGETVGRPCGRLRRLLERIRARFVGAGVPPTSPPVQEGQPSQSPVLPGPLPGPIANAPPAEVQAPVVQQPGESANGAVSSATPRRPTVPAIGGESPPVAIKRPATSPASGGLLSLVGTLAGGLLSAAGPAVLGGLGAGVPGVAVALLTSWLHGRSTSKLAGTIASRFIMHASSELATQPQPATNPYQSPRVNVVAASQPEPPVFVPTQVIVPELAAIKKALETLGGQTPDKAKWVQQVYGFAKQLVNQTTQSV